MYRENFIESILKDPSSCSLGVFRNHFYSTIGLSLQTVELLERRRAH